MIRQHLTDAVTSALRQARVVALLGPRQSGKTTLARGIARGGAFPCNERLNYFDLEDPAHLDRLATPRLALDPLRGLIVIDEIQRRPDLFPTLRVLADREDADARFLVLGSASRDLIRQGSETLAGRIHFVDVLPFGFAETGPSSLDTLWTRGGFPPSFLAPTDDASWHWREQYIRTYLERDIPGLGIRIPPPALRRFWMMLAHYHGQAFNASEIARSLGVADTTAAHYLDVLAGTFMVRRLPAWFENLGKRQVKTPKIYFRDTGIYHRLMDIPDRTALANHPKLGASWEGMALEQLIRANGASDEQVFFWGIHNQAELDLLMFRGGQRLGYEVKYTDRPRLSKSQHLALEHLRLTQLTVVIPGAADYPIGDRIHVRGLETLIEGAPHPLT